MDERIYQSSLEEHTLPLAQQHTVGLNCSTVCPRADFEYIKYNITFSCYQIFQQKWRANVFCGYILCLWVTVFLIHVDVRNSQHQYNDQYDLRYEDVKWLLLSKGRWPCLSSMGRELCALILLLWLNIGYELLWCSYSLYTTALLCSWRCQVYELGIIGSFLFPVIYVHGPVY